MKFKKTSYYIPNETKNKTNSKTYTSLENGFAFYAKFRLNEFDEEESLVVGRQGYHMGIFVQKPNGIKFAWYVKPYLYQDIWIPVKNIYKTHEVLASVSSSVRLYINGELVGEAPTGDIEDYSDKRIYIGSINPFGNYECWFNGDIDVVKVFDAPAETPDDPHLYTYLDFQVNSKFKTFDKSNNGNHGIIVENPDNAAKSINDFNKVAPGAKII